MAAAIIALGCARRRAADASAPDLHPPTLRTIVHTMPGLSPPVSGTAEGHLMRPPAGNQAHASHPLSVRRGERAADVHQDNVKGPRVRGPRDTRTSNNITQWGGCL
ncbi:hypothetical protein CJO79_23785 (plasmid) [Ralstonia solanacearum]|nr:hypothetical protein CJO76_23800 [Ralstonia solanacearum]AXV93911.1 hypothetical protein CJO79_23785 [Ralstonia solanacearum]AXW21894.1 hypothetical protein CJO85_23915 [Ralstonia solanacearum]AXW78805.1 hypothetical protein CJO97_23790 [Ralstonia solanacearum]BEU75110.1 hypothetical protein MAFF211271_46650 [Ralstonia pseudosolanacearum]